MFTVEKLGPSGGSELPVSTAQDRLLELLAELGEPATLAALSAASGLHPNTVRGHLDVLLARGRVTRLKTRVRGRGRPAWTYAAREAPYAGLAEALAAGLEEGTGLSPAEAARRGGRRWGERLTTRLALDDTAPRERVLIALEHVGFRPELDDTGVVRLTHCPFLDAAHAHPDAVCSVHQGLLEGTLGATVETGALKPFARPGACLVELPEETE